MWRGREIKLVDGTTIQMSDTEDNQDHYPQHGNQAVGVGFPLARLVGVISLSTGALIDAVMGPHKGKGTRDHLVCWPKPARPDWMSLEDYQGYADEISIREVKVRKESADYHAVETKRGIEKNVGRVVFAALVCEAGLEKH